VPPSSDGTLRSLRRAPTQLADRCGSQQRPAALRFLAREPRDLAEVWEALDCVISETYRAEDILGGIREQIKKAPRQESLDLRPFQQVIKFVRGELFKQPVSVQTRLPQGLPLVQGDQCNCNRSC
jgi:hypothetical protein